MISVRLEPFEQYCDVDIERSADGKLKLVASVAAEIQTWIDEHLSGQISLHHDFSRKLASASLRFAEEKDAVLFRLRWC